MNTQTDVPSGLPLIEVTRGDIVESVHDVAACAVNSAGEMVFAIGDITTPVFLRSAAKPFIAAAVVAAGAVERFGLEPSELALMAGSHAGEAFHVAGVRSILRKIGVPEEALQCGGHAPYNHAAACALERAGQPFGAVHNNCSGKHAGILALCRLLEDDTATYLDVAHPAQQKILEFCARMIDEDINHMQLALDGCGVPVFATSLRAGALAFMRFATLTGVAPAQLAALRTVRDAMASFPLHVCGTGEFDAALMEAAGGGIVCKAGAEGVHGDALIQAGLGLVLKITDGGKRAVGPAAMALVEELGGLAPAALTTLQRYAAPELRNRAGRVIGAIRSRRAIVAQGRRV